MDQKKTNETYIFHFLIGVKMDPQNIFSKKKGTARIFVQKPFS